MPSTSSRGVLNKWLKRDLHQLKKFCAENGLETFRAKSFESVLWQSIYNQTALKTVRIKTLASDNFRIITNNFHFICAEYGLEKWFNPPQRVRVLALDFQSICDKGC